MYTQTFTNLNGAGFFLFFSISICSLLSLKVFHTLYASDASFNPVKDRTKP